MHALRPQEELQVEQFWWCPRSESNRHAFKGGGFSSHFGFRRPVRKTSRGFVVWSTPSP